MDSDVDMFNSQPLLGKNYEDPSSSCPAVLKFFYGYVILFNWDESKLSPFKMYARKEFTKEEIPNQWLETKLIDKWRLKKLKPLSPLPGQKMSIFAKVEGCK